MCNLDAFFRGRLKSYNAGGLSICDKKSPGQKEIPI